MQEVLIIIIGAESSPSLFSPQVGSIAFGHPSPPTHSPCIPCWISSSLISFSTSFDIRFSGFLCHFTHTFFFSLCPVCSFAYILLKSDYGQVKLIQHFSIYPQAHSKDKQKSTCSLCQSITRMVSSPLVSIILHFCLCLIFVYLRLRPVVTIKQKGEKIKHHFNKSHLSFVKRPQQM